MATLDITTCDLCGCNGAICATPDGEIANDDQSLTSIAEEIAMAGLIVLCHDDKGRMTCEDCYDAEAQS